MHVISGTRAAHAIIAFTLVAAFAGCGPLPNAKSPAPPPRTESAPAAPAPAPSEPVPVPVVPPAPIALDGEPALDIGLAWDLETARVGFDGTQPLEVQSVDRPGTHSTAGPVDFRISGNQLLVTPNDRPRAVPLLVLHAGDTLWVARPAG